MRTLIHHFNFKAPHRVAGPGQMAHLGLNQNV